MPRSARPFVASAFFLCLSCARLLGPEPGGEGILVLSYNVLSLFDGRDDGTEFPEFSVAGGRWSEASYGRRLGLLAEVVLAAAPPGRAPSRRGPDIACLLELENRGVLDALAEGPLAAAGYRHRAMAPVAGQAFGCGVLSRLPIASLRSHALSVDSRAGRPVLELELEAGGENLRLFVCHWKSKVGGAAPTEGERREAAALVEGRVAAILREEPRAAVLVCGDFNESPDEYARVGGAYPTALLPAELAALHPDSSGLLLAAGTPEAVGTAERSGPRGRPLLWSPWELSRGWSYVHEGRTERIDGFLLSSGLLDGEGLDFRSFRPMDEPFLLDASGLPLAWSSARGTGYSDHLPLVLELGATKKSQ